jgi:TPR repeat protein
MRARLVLAILAAVLGGGCSRGAGGTGDKTGAATTPPTPAAKPSACAADQLGPLDARKMYARCDGVEDDCRARCERDDVEACFGLAMILEQRQGADDPDDAGRLYRKACLLGAPNACTNHAAHLWARSEDPADLACAQRLFEATCEHDDPFGCGMAGRLLLDHAEGPDHADVSRARAILERSCSQIAGFPCRVLALNLERGRLGVVPAGRIRTLLQQACDGGDTPACGEHATVEETFGPR